MDGASSGSCPVVAFGISGAETLGCMTRELAGLILTHFQQVPYILVTQLLLLILSSVDMMTSRYNNQ